MPPFTAESTHEYRKGNGGADCGNQYSDWAEGQSDLSEQQNCPV